MPELLAKDLTYRQYLAAQSIRQLTVFPLPVDGSLDEKWKVHCETAARCALDLADAIIKEEARRG